MRPGLLAMRVFAISLALTVAAVVALATAPAVWLDALAEAQTSGRLRLAEAEGTVWRGSGRLVWVDTGESAESRLSLSGLALPGRVHWQLSPLALLLGLVEATLKVDGMSQPVALQGDFSALRIGNGRMDLPRLELSALGSPWNTVRPAGAAALAWSNISLGRQRFEGSITIELRAVASALSAVRPLGSYRIEVRGGGAKAEVTMSTIEGALNISGSGQLGPGGMSFSAQARAADSGDQRLQGLLGLLGPRSGDATVIRIGS